MAIGERRPTAALVVRSRALRAAVQDDDQRRLRRQARRNILVHAQLAGIGAETGDLAQPTLLPVDLFRPRLYGGQCRQEFLPAAAMRRLRRQLCHLGNRGHLVAQFVQHRIAPVVGYGGEHADLDQFSDRQEDGVEETRIGSPAALWIEPGRRRGIAAEAVVVTDDCAPALPPGAELQRGHRAAAVDPDAEQLAGNQGARVVATGKFEQTGQSVGE
ncbi:MAG: hypothetical protein AW12_02100 [Candidatus Accumulibacter sp. BA-94]|nr:MAG: hypothetical protein AW12_02100 [Candidatus Accumulibacter sp. BA-94]